MRNILVLAAAAGMMLACPLATGAGDSPPSPTRITRPSFPIHPVGKWSDAVRSLKRAKAVTSSSSFSADIKVAHIPATMQFALPGSIWPDPVYGDFSYPAYAAHFYQCNANYSSCTFIELHEDCSVTDCLSGTAVAMSPEQGLACEVSFYDADSYGYWPCQFSVNVARDTFHIVGSTTPTPTADPVSASAQYVAGPNPGIDGGDGTIYSCPSRRSDALDALVASSSNAQFDATDPANDVAPDGCNDGTDIGSTEMDAASDILEAHLTLTLQPPSPVVLNQHGLTGTWFNPDTTGEGFVFEEYPSIGLLSAGWFTYAMQPGGPEAQRWYVLSGDIPADATQVELSIGAAYGGNFDAPPTVPIDEVGRATLRLESCTRGRFEYLFEDGRQGVIDLTRFTGNVSCTDSGTVGSEPAQYLLSGNWSNPALGGQGIQFELNTEQHLLFAPWYSYAPAGSDAADPLVTQRWYTLQLQNVDPAATEFHDIGVFSTVGGVFDAHDPVSTTQVGTADVVFHSCASATLIYSFTSGENNGRSNSIDLSRVGPVPEGCVF